MKRLKLGVIGAGHLGRIHARLLKGVESVDLVGVADPVSAARQRVADELGVAAYAHHNELIGKIDAAIVATPTSCHHDVALELLRSGIHCLVEKPLAPTVAEADSLVRAAREHRRVLQVGHVERFNPALAALPPLCGPVRYLEAARATGYSFRSTDIGVVLDLMIHDIDLALTLAGGNLIDVQAVGMTVIGPHEDIAQARLTFDNGCAASLFASRVSPAPQRTFSIYADELHATLDLATGAARLLKPCDKVLRGEFDLAALSLEEQHDARRNLFTQLLATQAVQAGPSNAILEEQQDFLRGIQSGRAVRVPGEAGRQALAVAEAILERISASGSAQPLLAEPHFPRLAVHDFDQPLRRAG